MSLENFKLLKIDKNTFTKFQTFIYDKVGISLSDQKMTLVESRLAKRVRELNLTDFEQYYNYVVSPQGISEVQSTIDLLTTNETFFFREMPHFDFLKNKILKGLNSNTSYSVWSAASSTGEEAYSISMVLAERFGLYGQWQVVGTDINSQVLKDARKAVYSIELKGSISDDYQRKYCSKNQNGQDGLISIDDKIKTHVTFSPLNLNGDWPSMINNFDLVFLRNVMIYFDVETKKKLINRLADRIVPGGYLFVGHSESIHGLCDSLQLIQPSVYQKKS